MSRDLEIRLLNRDEPVAFVIHCHQTGPLHTLYLRANGQVQLSHHANPDAEYTLCQLGGAPRLPMCLRWWRVLRQSAALRQRLYTLAQQGINPLEAIRVIEDADGAVWCDERPGLDALSLEGMIWDLQGGNPAIRKMRP